LADAQNFTQELEHLSTGRPDRLGFALTNCHTIIYKNKKHNYTDSSGSPATLVFGATADSRLDVSFFLQAVALRPPYPRKTTPAIYKSTDFVYFMNDGTTAA
jgi:hypothetical protein